MTYSCRTKTALLFVLVIALFAILYIDSPLFKSERGTVGYNNNSSTDNKGNNGSNNMDKFTDLQQLTAPINSSSLVPDAILKDYTKLFTPESIAKLSDTAGKATAIYKENNGVISSKLNVLDSNINAAFVTINKKLYEQLGKNYERSQQINNIRHDWLLNIEDLPYTALD